MDTLKTLGHVYLPRVIDSLVTASLASAGAVLIEGARGCGKTMTAINAAASYALLDDPNTVELAKISPALILDGSQPRLLDEWQLAPQLWNLVRRKVDAASAKGLYLLTGSAVPADDITRHSGAGRMLRLRQRTMTWYEKLGAQSSDVSLTELFDGHLPETTSSPSMTYQDVVAALLLPGFPALTPLSPPEAFRMLRAYIDEVARADMPRLVDMRHDPVVVNRLITAIARSTASEVSNSTLASDIGPVAPNIRPETVASYVGVLERLFLTDPQPAWTPALRSRARLRSSPRLHLADPALAAAALGATQAGLEKDPKTVGLLFESAVVHDLRVHASLLDGEVRSYRDSNGYEIDVVVSLPDGRWGAIEVKLGAGHIPAGMESLNAAVAQIDDQVTAPPVFRLVVTGTGPTFVAGDGTITCPLAALRP
ncbi:MAG: DUF4143 domain-containing protein [Propionibacteriaceae bacterium]|nr:DUF4143 domain-containing protein [Propionibacteriaceae bacterium]